MTKRYILTFDIDWAPDFVIEDCLSILDQFGKNATFFTTHDTPMNQEIVNRGHILGIHPNFLQNSTHGSNVETVVKKCLSYAPKAWCLRTHGLVQSTPLLLEIFSKFPQLKLDVSLLMHRSPFAYKSSWELESVFFERLIFNWEDDFDFSNNRKGEKNSLFVGELTVFNFHPIHVFLNSFDGEEYQSLKRKTSILPLNELDINVLSFFQNSGFGTRNNLIEILRSDHKCIRLNEL